MSHLPIVWRNQYHLMHKTVPESPCAMLLDLENMEKVFAERYNEKAQANKAKAARATKAAELCVPKKRHDGGFDRGTPQKGQSTKYCKWCKSIDGPFTAQDTSKCRRFSKDCSLKDKPTKPFNSAKKTWKKTGNGDSSQVAYLTERLIKL